MGIYYVSERYFVAKNSVYVGVERQKYFQIVHKSSQSAKTRSESDQKEKQVCKNTFPTN